MMEEKRNMTAGIFLLVGFPVSRHVQILLFFLFFLMYLLTLVQNLLVIILVWTSPRLRKPMYFFLGHLSFLEIWYVTVTVPKLLFVLITGMKQISIHACIFQLYFFLLLVCTECVLLATMAFDRFVAICIPLHYVTIMNQQFCFNLASGSWVIGFLISLVKIYYIASLQFCHSGVINHFFCDISPVLNLSCSDIRLAELMDFILAIIVLFVPLILTVISYVCILYTICQIPTSSGRFKTFSTCASHLTVVIIFFTAALFMYARPSRAQSLNYHKLISIIYTVLTPLLNPIIYALRNKEVKNAIWKLFSHSKIHSHLKCKTLH